MLISAFQCSYFVAFDRLNEKVQNGQEVLRHFSHTYKEIVQV